MPTAFIETQAGTVIKLDAVTEISENHAGSTSDNPVTSGDVVTDNYINEPSTFSVSGVITDGFRSASPLEQEAVGDVILNDTVLLKGVLQQLKISKETFSYVSPSGTVYSPCVFTNMAFTKDPSMYDGWEVALDIKELLLRQGSALTETEVPSEDVADDVSGKKDSSSDNTEEGAVKPSPTSLANTFGITVEQVEFLEQNAQKTQEEIDNL